MKKPELLVPAGSLEVLKIAVTYGADAVYVGGESFGLRAKAKNFSMEDLEKGIAFAHQHDVKVYVTANILAHNEDLDGVRDYFQELKKKNENIIAWLYAQNTEINYPIVQGKDNEEYLHKLINGKNNKAGTLFIDYRNSKDLPDENTIIYGHNMKNGTMFGCLDEYKKQSYYEEHKMMYLLTEEKNYKIELFAGYTLPANSKIYNVSAVSNSKEEMITSAKQKSTFQSDTEINENERIVTLSTCSYEYDEARYVVMGVLREI